MRCLAAFTGTSFMWVLVHCGYRLLARPGKVDLLKPSEHRILYDRPEIEGQRPLAAK